jgi:hypothetical protein
LLDRVFEVGVIGECLVERIQIEAIVIQAGYTAGIGGKESRFAFFRTGGK